MAEIHPHPTVAGVQATDGLFRAPDFDLVLKFHKMRHPNSAGYKAEHREADASILRTMEKTWPPEAYSDLMRVPAISRRRGGVYTKLFTPINMYDAFLEARLPIPPGLQHAYTKQRQSGLPPRPEYVVMADGRRFGAQYLTDDMSPIFAMHYCFNKAVQQLMQGVGSQRRAIRKLLAYWKTPAPRDDEVEKRIGVLFGGSLAKTQTWDFSDMAGGAGWDDKKASALQYFWLATMYYLDALAFPPPPMAESGFRMAKDIPVLVPNPERVRYNQMLFTTVGPYVFEENRLSMGTQAYASIIVLPTEENSTYDNPAAAVKFIKDNFKTVEEVSGQPYARADVYVGGYLGYRWKNAMTYALASPFFSEAAAFRICATWMANFDLIDDDVNIDAADFSDNAELPLDYVPEGDIEDGGFDADLIARPYAPITPKQTLAAANYAALAATAVGNDLRRDAIWDAPGSARAATVPLTFAANDEGQMLPRGRALHNVLKWLLSGDVETVSIAGSEWPDGDGDWDDENEEQKLLVDENIFEGRDIASYDSPCSAMTLGNNEVLQYRGLMHGTRCGPPGKWWTSDPQYTIAIPLLKKARAEDYDARTFLVMAAPITSQYVDLMEQQIDKKGANLAVAIPSMVQLKDRGTGVGFEHHGVNRGALPGLQLPAESVFADKMADLMRAGDSEQLQMFVYGGDTYQYGVPPWKTNVWE